MTTKKMTVMANHIKFSESAVIVKADPYLGLPFESTLIKKFNKELDDYANSRKDYFK